MSTAERTKQERATDWILSREKLFRLRPKKEHLKNDANHFLYQKTQEEKEKKNVKKTFITTIKPRQKPPGKIREEATRNYKFRRSG